VTPYWIGFADANGNVQFATAAAVPEPASVMLALLAGGVVGLVVYRRSRGPLAPT
jgi:hypothetical protein